MSSEAGLRRVLVANRGEIAVRIIRACFDEGLQSVVALSQADMSSLPAKLADRAVCIGPPSAPLSYLNVGAVVTAALGTGCDALHPGYGFLAERPELAQACAENGIAFVGPAAQTIRQGGDKVAARQLARSLGIPLGAGSDTVETLDEARHISAGVDFPVLLKAAAGGGGRGMVLIRSAQELEQRFEGAHQEALQAFGDGRLYVEHYVERARHVEVQVLADRYGSVVHLGERDCSAQRRYQKLLEEAPAADLPQALRRELYEAALALGKALDYVGAGTMEFIVDREQDTFAFLEVNTRVQVEHPVTEMVTGVDIVREQLRVAGGARLSVSQGDVCIRGHAIECRINAEAPQRGFIPTPGRLEEWVVPQGSDVRVDTHCQPGYLIPPYYDSMLAKVIVRGDDRNLAADRMSRALGHLRTAPVETTAVFHRAVVDHPDFRGARVTTKWVEDTFLPEWLAAPAGPADTQHDREAVLHGAH